MPITVVQRNLPKEHTTAQEGEWETQLDLRGAVHREVAVAKALDDNACFSFAISSSPMCPLCFFLSLPCLCSSTLLLSPAKTVSIIILFQSSPSFS